jgi:hypothetical protein
MKKGLFLTVLFALLFFVGCSSSDQQMKVIFDDIEPKSSMRLYENTFTSTGATGPCSSIVTHRWYGSSIPYDDLTLSYESNLKKKGWQLEPNSIIGVWQHQIKEGLLNLYLEDFSDKNTMDLQAYQRVYGQLPESLINEIGKYNTVFVVSLSFQYTEMAERCSKK